MKRSATFACKAWPCSAVALTASNTLTATEGHSLSQKALEIARPFGFPIANSMVVTWIVALGLIVFAQVATRNMKNRCPTDSRIFWNGWLRASCTAFWERRPRTAAGSADVLVLAPIFIFILASNSVGLFRGSGWNRLGGIRLPRASGSRNRSFEGPTLMST